MTRQKASMIRIAPILKATFTGFQKECIRKVHFCRDGEKKLYTLQTAWLSVYPNCHLNCCHILPQHFRNEYHAALGLMVRNSELQAFFIVFLLFIAIICPGWYARLWRAEIKSWCWFDAEEKMPTHHRYIIIEISFTLMLSTLQVFLILLFIFEKLPSFFTTLN